MSQKQQQQQRWKWSDANATDPVIRSPRTRPIEPDTQPEHQAPSEPQKTLSKTIDCLENFFDNTHMREDTYELMAKREPIRQMGTNPFLNNNYIDGITIRDKYLMPYHENKPRTNKETTMTSE